MTGELITRAAQGDADAYEQIMHLHQEAVFRLAYVLLGDAQDAQDVAQDTFIRAYHQLHRFDTTRPLRPWLLQITRNLARNRQRATGRYLAALQRAFMLKPRAALIAASAETEHVQRGDVQMLWEAIQQLPTPDQEVIYLRYLLDLSTQETADILEIKPGTVKSRLSRALDRLRGIVQDDFPLLMEGRTL
ncbi:MAG: RNA polymerase sigma factor [Anaerolineae bacterium]|nr:RNA polymerase sigma factor [Anaerolineae bacterium]